MVFLNTTDMLVLEKNGNVQRVTNGILQDKPVLQVQVQSESERGLLGIAAKDNGSALSDLVVDNNQEFSSIIFGTGFGGITDIKTARNGFLYIVSIGDGSIYRFIHA